MKIFQTPHRTSFLYNLGETDSAKEITANRSECEISSKNIVAVIALVTWPADSNKLIPIEYIGKNIQKASEIKLRRCFSTCSLNRDYSLPKSAQSISLTQLQGSIDNELLQSKGNGNLQLESSLLITNNHCGGQTMRFKETKNCSDRKDILESETYSLVHIRYCNIYGSERELGVLNYDLPDSLISIKGVQTRLSEFTNSENHKEKNILWNFCDKNHLPFESHSCSSSSMSPIKKIEQQLDQSSGSSWDGFDVKSCALDTQVFVGDEDSNISEEEIGVIDCSYKSSNIEGL